MPTLALPSNPGTFGIFGESCVNKASQDCICQKKTRKYLEEDLLGGRLSCASMMVQVEGA